MDLDPRCRDRLLELWSDAFRAWYAERDLTLFGRTREILPRVTAEIVDEWLGPSWPEIVSACLNDGLEVVRDPEDAARRLLAWLEALPRPYRLYVALGHGWQDEKSWLLDDRTRFTTGAALIASGVERCRIAGYRPLNIFAKREKRFPAVDEVYAVLDVDGYLHRELQTNTEDLVIRRVQTLRGLFFATGIYNSFLRELGWVRTIVSESGTEGTPVLWVANLSKEMRSHSIRRKETERNATLHLLRRAFVPTPSQTDSAIRLAASWLADSVDTRDGVLALVQAVIALEVLYGRDGPGITRMLATKCAYSIATSESERKELLDWLPEVYNLRSEIVHEGRSRLASEEREALKLLQQVVGRSIVAELRLLTASDRTADEHEAQ